MLFRGRPSPLELGGRQFVTQFETSLRRLRFHTDSGSVAGRPNRTVYNATLFTRSPLARRSHPVAAKTPVNADRRRADCSAEWNDLPRGPAAELHCFGHSRIARRRVTSPPRLLSAHDVDFIATENELDLSS